MRGLYRSRSIVSKLVLVGMLAAVVSCSDPGPEQKHEAEHVADASDALFALDHLVEVVVELAPADFAKLRSEGRGVSVLAGDVTPYDYTYFPATVTVDGVQ